MSAWVLLMCLLGQSDGGMSPPPPPPEAIPEGLVFPRVIRTPGKVCIESLDEAGAVKTECRAEEELRSPPQFVPQAEPPSSAVADLGVLGGGLLATNGALFPE